MTLKEARKIIEEIHEKYGIQFSECREERRNGRVKFLDCTLKFMIDEIDNKNVLTMSVQNDKLKNNRF